MKEQFSQCVRLCVCVFVCECVRAGEGEGGGGSLPQYALINWRSAFLLPSAAAHNNAYIWNLTWKFSIDYDGF